MQPQSLKEFRITKALHIDPTYLVIVEAGQKIIDRLDFAFLDRVRVILCQRYDRFPALILRRYDQRGRRSTGRWISQFIHRSVSCSRGDILFCGRSVGIQGRPSRTGGKAPYTATRLCSLVRWAASAL